MFRKLWGFLSFPLALLHSVPYRFFLYWSPSPSLCSLFDAFSSKIDKVLPINTSTNVFVFGDFNVHHEDWLNYLVKLIELVKSGMSFFISNDLTPITNFPTRISDCDSHSPALFHFFLFSDPSICSAITFPPLGSSDYAVVSVSVDFPSDSKRGSPFHCTTCGYSHADWDGLRNHLRDVPRDDIFKPGASVGCCWFSYMGPSWNWCIYTSS